MCRLTGPFLPDPNFHGTECFEFKGLRRSGYLVRSTGEVLTCTGCIG